MTQEAVIQELPNIHIYRIVIKEKYGYFVPSRYRTHTKLIYVDEKGEHEFWYTKKIRTYNQFIAWVKSKFGNERNYTIDTTNPPYVHWITDK